ncbi:hypothetical protein FPRO05_03921 [Fusarium proliferatum]|uniref:Uncharacterized protein n=1 Tax=Gibberella intermedia TaxID=948311 RepID=A0A365MV97_GIBIN|nr:hypothetical protein FPRO05_03921 [Fusarium proliferatum]
MDLENEDRWYIDSDAETDSTEAVYYKENSGFSPSCGLCRFNFSIDDSVVVFKERCEPWTTTYSEPEIWWTIHYSKHTFHAECVDLAPDLMSDQRLDPGIYNATILEPLQEGRYPLPSIQTRRLKWLKKSFSEQLFQTIKNRLPLEVCENIAQYCLQERAVQVVRHHWLRKDRPKPGRISVAIREDKPLWAQYLEFEGIRYVKSLSYQSLGGDESQILSNPDSDCNVNIFIAHNYLGVTEIILTRNSEIPSVKEEPGRWWTIFTPSKMSFCLKAKFDSFGAWQLTSIAITSRGFQKIYGGQYFQQPWILFLSPRYLVLILCMGNTIMRIILHKVGEKHPYDFGSTSQHRYSWVYFPVDSDERISEVWIRRYGFKLPRDSSSPVATLILRTRVRTVTPCRSWRHPDGILGLLLTYEDGRKRCVGEVRLDHLLAPIEVTSDTMWIVYPETDEISWCSHDEDESGFYFVSFEEPDADEWEGQCIKIPMRGRLDWYFSQHQCHLSHRDDSEPQDKFLEALAQEPAPGEKAAEPGVDKCHGRRSYPISLHLECVKYAESFVTGSLRDVAAAAVTIRGSFNGPEEMCGPRRRWLENTVTQNLSHALRGRLPTEICRNVAIYCIREQSIRFIHQMWQRQTRRGFISVPVYSHTTLWAQYTHFEGIRYLRSFSYDSQGGDEDFLIKGNTENPLNIFARHNHLGVNKLVITEGHERPETEEAHNYWWTCHAQQHRPFHFKARFDGIKIRNLVVVKTPKTFLNFAMDGCEIRWAVPPSPVKFSPKIPLVSGIPWTDVQSLDWNKPGTSGYSFLLFGESVVQCNFHHVHGPPVPYQKYTTGEPNDLLCLHFPMNLDERVSELWIRQYPERTATLIMIQIVTDRGRSLVLGSQQDGPGATYHVVAKLPQDKPCFMFHAHSYTFSWFHFDSVLSWEKPQARQIQPAWKPAHEMTIGTHYSSAKLYGVRDITPCINRGPFTWGDDEIIQGLLLTYHDDTRTCIGEVRCDSLGTPQKVTSDTMWIRYVEYKKAGILDENTHCCDCGIEWFGFSQPLLGSFSSHKDKDVPTDEHDSDEEQTSHQDDSSAEDESEDETESDDDYDRSPKYVSLPMRGRLDWVKESDGSICLLSHHMRSRPDDEMLHVLAEDAKADRVDPVSKSCTILTGETTPENLRPEKIAKEFDNYARHAMALEFADSYGGGSGIDIEALYFSGSCGLCRFRLDHGDKAISYRENTEPIKYTFGGPDSPRRTNRMIYHLACVECTSRTLIFDSQLSYDVSVATFLGGRFDMHKSLSRSRLRWLERTFGRHLFDLRLGRLPQELCCKIAADCKEQTVRVFQRLWSKSDNHRAGNISVPIETNTVLWAEYVNYEGSRYIRSLSYESRGGDEEVVLDRKAITKPLNVFIRHNGRGVNKVIFTEWEERPDGFKLRGLGVTKSPYEFLKFAEYGSVEIRWDIPPTTVKLWPRVPLPRDSDSRISHTYVRSMEWNKPDTVAYSFCLVGSAIVQCNSHQDGNLLGPGESDPRLRREEIMRLFFPMNPHEKVSELWVVTNHGRNLVLGTHEDIPGAIYHCVAKLPEDTPSRMFYTGDFDGLPASSVAWLHFDSVSTWENPMKYERQCAFEGATGSFYSSASLDNVRQVTPCMNSYVCRDTETGLLFTYTDGTRRCVGDFHFDPEQWNYSLPVDSDAMWAVYLDSNWQESKASKHTIMHGFDSDTVNFRPLSRYYEGYDDDNSLMDDGDGGQVSRTTFVVPMSGRLDWTRDVGSGKCELSHHPSGEPKNEMRGILAKYAASDAAEQKPIVKSLTLLLGNVDPNNLDKVYREAENNGNYAIYGL